MGSSNIRIGSLFGVPISVSWTLGLLAFIFASALATGQFPDQHPGYSQGEYWLSASITIGLFFLTILLHEIAHSIAARRRGLTVEGITLWLFGGVALMSGEPETPRAQAFIAAVGPLSSLAMGLGALGIAWGLESLGVSPLVVAVANWLGVINVILGAFNAIPAAPLDGGAVLTAFLWWKSKDRVKARQTSAVVGQFFGLSLVALGSYSLVTQSNNYGFWTVFVGWFLWQNASVERRTANLWTTFAGLTAVEATTPDPLIVDEGITVDGLIAMSMNKDGHAAFVIREDDGVLRSIVTLDDIRRVPANKRSEVRLNQIATPIESLITAWATEPLMDVLARSATSSRPEVVVYDERMCLVGVISRFDLMRLANAHPKPSANLPGHDQPA